MTERDTESIPVLIFTVRNNTHETVLQPSIFCSYITLKVCIDPLQIRQSFHKYSAPRLSWGKTVSVTCRGVQHQGPVSWRPTTFKRRQFSQPNRHSTIGIRHTQYHKALPSSVNVQSHLTSSMVTLHDTRFVECRWWNDGWTVKTVVT